MVNGVLNHDHCRHLTLLPFLTGPKPPPAPARLGVITI